MVSQTMLDDIHQRLAAVFGERLKGVVLYGSEARGEAEPDSDIDLLVLLEGPVELGKDLDTVIRAIYPVQLETDRLIDACPVDVEAYEAGDYAFYRRARREGVRV